MSDNEEQAPVIKVRGRRAKQTDKKEKPRASNWFVTISTNQRYKPDDPHKESDAEILEELVEEILQDLPKYIKIKEEGHIWSIKHIQDVDTTYTVEYGPRSRALHTHIFIKTKHQTKLQLDYTKIKERFKERLGLDNVYCHVRLMRRTTEQDIENYLAKYD